jgi:hypothetical protein
MVGRAVLKVCVIAKAMRVRWVFVTLGRSNKVETGVEVSCRLRLIALVQVSWLGQLQFLICRGSIESGNEEHRRDTVAAKGVFISTIGAFAGLSQVRQGPLSCRQSRLG